MTVEGRDITPFINDFKAEKYNKVCEKGSALYYGGYTDENFVSLVGVSCAKVDRINVLGMFQRSLVSTKSSRENASYFSTLILQKKTDLSIYDRRFGAEQLKASHIKPSSFTGL